MGFQCQTVKLTLFTVEIGVLFSNQDSSQLLFGILLMPLNTLSFLGTNTLPWEKLFSSLVDGSMCLVGVNSVTDNCYMPGQPTNGTCS